MDQTQDRQDVRQGRRLQLSLPQGFAYNYTEAGPKTPESREPSVDANTFQPPNPPKVRIHRRRPFPTAPLGPADFDASNELSVPTIQLPELSSDFGPVLSFAGSELEDGLLAPSSRTARSYKRYGRIISPPKTPLDQIFNSFDAAFSATTPVPILTPQQTLESSVPQSPANFSDSEDSDDSSDSGPSWEEDFGSPDAELPDAFSQLHSAGLSSPMTFSKSRPSSFRSSMQFEKQKWTPEMDEHLWVTYMSYLADPVHTPFKMLPGTAPPLGVCHRVARDAKKSWKGAAPRSPASPSADVGSADFMNVDNNAEQFYLMPRYQQQYTRQVSAADMPRKTNTKWLRTEGSTRRRLRHLCKRNPTLAAHYHRLVQSRTPSPFEASSSSKRGSSRFASPPPADTDSAFATRDLDITLATSTAASMQPDAPLAQLAQDLPIKPRPYSTEYSRPARRGVHHRSQSLQLGLGLNLQPVDTTKFRDLASPFHEAQQPDWLSAPVPASAAPSTLRMASVREDITEEGSSIKIHAPRPLSGSLKRRSGIPAGANELVTGDSEKRRSMIQNLFRSSVDEGDTRFHGRASTVGAIRHSTCSRHLSDIFTPPTIAEQTEPLPSPITSAHTRQSSLADQMSSYRLPPPPEIPRLASPFAPAPNARFSRTFPRTSYHPSYNSMVGSQQHTSAAQNRQTWDGTQSPHTRLY